MVSASPTVGEMLRHWRQQRRLSQLALACDAEVSTRHLSYLETGRATPSRHMLLRLAEHLDVPLRERNRLLTAAGYAPVYAERGLADPSGTGVRAAIDRLLRCHEPYPALVIDRHWNLVSYNAAIPPFLAGLGPDMLRAPVNVLRLSLHPRGLAPRIANLAQWRAHLLTRLRHQITTSGDPVLADLLQELQALPAPADAPDMGVDPHWVAVPILLHSPQGLLSFISTTTVFGTPVEVTLSELALETLLPADEHTARALHDMAASAQPEGRG